MPVLEMRNIRRYYQMGDFTVKALRGIDLTVEPGEFIAIMGPSGSGKSTLMNIIGCLDKPTDGTYLLDGLDTGTARSNDFAEIRNGKIGFVFQGFNLLPRTSALENVELPLFYSRGEKNGTPRTRALRALETVGLGDRVDHIPSQLSGGQQQRVAIARALVNEPVFILADEPTGNLDTETTLEIMSLFQTLNDSGITVIMVTHEPELSCYMKRIITVRDGAVVSDTNIGERKQANADLAQWRKANAHLRSENEEKEEGGRP